MSVVKPYLFQNRCTPIARKITIPITKALIHISIEPPLKYNQAINKADTLPVTVPVAAEEEKN